MPREWIDIPTTTRLYENVEEEALTTAMAAQENCFQTEADGFSRFPGIATFVQLPDKGRVFLCDWKGSMIAATSNGYVYRIDKNGNAENVTKVSLAGRGRPIFTKTPDELVIASGQQAIRFAGKETEILAQDAPDATYVGFIDNYVLFAGADSGRFAHTLAGLTRELSPLDVFAADSQPDDITALMITPFREVIVCGPDTIEQYERLTSGDSPFFRRWAVGEGLYTPYALLFADNAVFAVNSRREFVRFSGQASTPIGQEIGKPLEALAEDDWKEAWMGGFPDKPLHVLGQKFIILQFPNATNPYGTKGITYAYDYRQKKFLTLYGWDEANGVPKRWPVWSHWPLWEKIYVGGDDGKIGYLTPDSFTNFGEIQRVFGRTAILGKQGEMEIHDVRMRVIRGKGGNDTQSSIYLRAKRDNKRWTRWIQKGLGKAGDTNLHIHFGSMGIAEEFQFEWYSNDDVPLTISGLQAQVTRTGY